MFPWAVRKASDGMDVHAGATRCSDEVLYLLGGDFNEVADLVVVLEFRYVHGEVFLGLSVDGPFIRFRRRGPVGPGG